MRGMGCASAMFMPGIDWPCAERCAALKDKTAMRDNNADGTDVARRRDGQKWEHRMREMVSEAPVGRHP
jgi:hypothetical protein